MKVALIDNGSLAPDAHRTLRRIAVEVGARAGVRIEAVSWKHSDRIGNGQLDGTPVRILDPWLRWHLRNGEREFLFVPFFISPQGAIGSALRADIDAITGGAARVGFSQGLAESGVLPAIVTDQVRGIIRDSNLDRPALLVVDHGGPSRASAQLRDRTAEAVRGLLGGCVREVLAASMESPEGPAFAFNRPLFSEALGGRGFDAGDVVVAPLFLSPGRHAGPGGDLERIAAGAASADRIRFAGLVGSHPATALTLARGLRSVLAGAPGQARDDLSTGALASPPPLPSLLPLS